VRVALFATCLADTFFADAALAAVRLLRALGVDVIVPAAQTCCGQPAFNAGHRAEARRMAAHTVRLLDGVDAVVLPSGSCASMIRVHYPELFGNPPRGARADEIAASEVAALAGRTWELSEFIVKRLGVTELGAGLRGVRVAWHPGCHALRELHVRDEPLTLLRNAGATLVDWQAADECCGFGGVFAVKMPEVSVAMADRKIEGLQGDEAERIDVLSSTDAGCLLQLSTRMRYRGIGLPVAHVAELLWRAMRAAPVTPGAGQE
jgi:L-lactate dehydrogenase complex protein LldE